MLTVLLTATAAMAVTPMVGYADVNVAVQADETGTTLSGNCGAGENGTVSENVQWNLEKNGTDKSGKDTYKLTISGNGDMINYNPSTDMESLAATGTYPWYNLKDQITEIEVEDGVTGIGSKAFIAYLNVKKVTIGKDVKNIGIGSVTQLAACDTFVVSEENPYFTVGKDGALYTSDMKKLCAIPCASTAEVYELPDSVEMIGYGAFSRCANLTTITISDNSQLKQIGYGAFAFTTSLKNFKTIPDGIETGKDLFAGSGLKYAYCADEETKQDLIKEQVAGSADVLFITEEDNIIDYTDEAGYKYLLNYPAKGEAKILSAPMESIEEADLSEGIIYDGETYKVTVVAEGAFAKAIDYDDAVNKNIYNTKLKKVLFPETDSLELGDKSLYGCRNLKTIVIKAKNLQVGYAAFTTYANLSNSSTTLDISNVENIDAGTERWIGIGEIIVKNEEMLNAVEINAVSGTIAKTVDDDIHQWIKESSGWRKYIPSDEVMDENGITWEYQDDGTGEGISLIAYHNRECYSDIVVPSCLEINGEKITVTKLGSGLFGSDQAWGIHDRENPYIKSVIVPDTVTYVDSDVFRRADNLKTIVFRASKLTINSSRTFASSKSLTQVDFSSVKDLSVEGTAKTMFSGNSPVVYVSSEKEKNIIKNHSDASARISYAVTGGGILPAGTELKDKILASPIKSGKKFAHWYKAGNKNTTVTEAENGNTYYAEWAGTNYSIETDAKLGKVTYGYDDSEAEEASVTLLASGSDAEKITKATNSNAEYFDVEVKDNSITITPVTDLDAGEYHGTVYVTMGDNSVFYVEVTLTVKQAEPEYELPIGLKAIQGQTLADVEGLPEQFQWVKPETELKKYGLQKFKAVYTPTDTKNYLTAKCEIDVDVMPQALIMNHVPTINAKDLKLIVGDTFNPLKGVTANDEEDGDITENIEVFSNTVDTTKSGTYQVIYKATDNEGATGYKIITVTVYPKMEALNAVPTITAENVTLTVGDTFDAKKNVTASDAEDGDLTAKIEITANDVDTTKAGTYHVMYKITDSKGASATKTITVTVKAKANANSSSSSSDSDDSDEPASSTTKKINLVSASTLEGFWKRNEKGWWFEAKDGSYPKSSWKLISWNGKQQWYHFDENGYMQTGWIKDNGIWYYLHNQADGSQGHMYTGWHLIDGKWYYFSEGMKQPQGAMFANTITPDGYEVGPDGAWTGK